MSLSNLNHNMIVELSRKLVLHVLYQAKRDNRQIAGLKSNIYNIERNIKRVVQNLWRRPGSFCTNKLVLIEPDGRIRATQYFINILLRFNDSMVFIENGGYTKIKKADCICLQSANKVCKELSLIEDITNEKNIISDSIDYDSIVNIVNGPTFKDPAYIVTNTVRIQEFTKSLLKLTTIETRLEEENKRLPYIINTHRLNLRMRDFIPWKLYANKPIYSDCMAPMSFYDETNRTDFDVRFIIPEDIGRIITEFVGYDFISNARKSIIMNKNESTRIDIQNALFTFTKRELLKFADSAPYNYLQFYAPPATLIFETCFKSSYRKGIIIMKLMTNFVNKENYYPFYRDVIILSKLLRTHRCKIRNNKMENGKTML